MTNGQFDERTLARAMTGHDRERLPDRSELTGAAPRPLLEIRDLVVPAAHGHGLAIDGLSLTVHSGEILGIAGVEGNGQRELVDALMGLTPPESGMVVVDGVEVTNADPHDRRTAGMGVIPEDRHRLGLILDMSLAENLAVADLASGRYRRRGRIDWKAVHKNAERLLVDYDVRPADPDATAASLSGGNQQKVVLAREMAREPRVLVADNPSWGLDVGAIDYVHLKLLEMRDRGGAVLLLTLDLEELYKLSDRILVVYRGENMLEGPTNQIDDDDLALAMVGRSTR
jgi:simple sugar transport system ATP-binding protein